MTLLLLAVVTVALLAVIVAAIGRQVADKRRRSRRRSRRARRMAYQHFWEKIMVRPRLKRLAAPTRNPARNRAAKGGPGAG